MTAKLFDLKIVTNDQPFATTAEALEIEVFTAEQIIIEALQHRIVTKDEVKKAMQLWEENNEKRPSLEKMQVLKSLLK